MSNGLFEGAEQTVTLTGDVTGSGTTSVATTIANDAVTYAKIQNVSATDKLLGRSSSGAGDVEEITCTAAGRALLDDANAAAQLTTLGVLDAIFTNVSRVAAWVWSATVSSVTYSLTIGTGNTTKIQTQTATYQNYAAANQTSAELRCSKLDSTAFGQVQAGASYSEVAFSNPSTSGVSRLRASLSDIFISVLNASGFGNSKQTTQPGQWTNLQQSTDDNTLTIKEYADGQTKGAGTRYTRVYDVDGSTVLAGWTINSSGHALVGMVDLSKTLSAAAYTPTQITSNQANYAGIHGRSLQVRISSDAARTINGITAGVDGELHIVRNVGSYDISFAHLSGSATGAQVYCDTLAATVLETGARGLLVYDSTSGVWVLTKLPNNRLTSALRMDAAAATTLLSAYWTGDTSNPTALIRNDANVCGELVLQLYTGTSKVWVGYSGFRTSSDVGFGIVNNTNAYGNVMSVQFGLAAAGVWDVSNEGFTAGTALSFKPLSPSQITSNQTNYSAFIGGSKVVRVSTDALRELQGIAAGTAGVEHVLILTGSNNLTIKHDSGSATGKRIYCHGSADITLAPNDILFLWFDATTDVWRAR